MRMPTILFGCALSLFLVALPAAAQTGATAIDRFNKAYGDRLPASVKLLQVAPTKEHVECTNKCTLYVIAFEVDGGKCGTYIPISSLQFPLEPDTARPGKKKPKHGKIEVTFDLVAIENAGTKRFEFSDGTQGSKKGIEILKATSEEMLACPHDSGCPESSDLTNDDFINGNAVGNDKKRFKWKLEGAREVTLSFKAHVNLIDGKRTTPCRPYDPLIINK